MQSNTAVSHLIFIALLEMPVHIGINQTKDDGFITYQCLVMTLTVRDGFLIRTTVLNLPEDAGWFPVFILLFLDGLDPIVRNIHRHAIVETITAILKLGSQTRHSAHLFGNRNGVLVYLMNQTVGKGKIADGIIILMTIEIISVVAECLTQTMTVIKHGCHTVKTESIEMELIEPVLAVAQQEVDDFILSIVEAETVPSRMLMTVARIEILVRIASEITQSFHLILYGMRVNDVHDDGNTILVSCINEILQLFRSSKAATCSKETAYMVAEGAIIRMLLDSHNLNAVVTILDDTWQHILLKFCVSANLLCILCHTDMAFIDEQRCHIWSEGFLLPFIWFRIPNLSRENLGLVVLYYALCPCRNTLTFTTFPMNFHLEEIAMFHGFLRNFEFPVAGILYSFGTILFGFLPVVEITYQIDVCSIRCPLTEHPSTGSLMQSEILVSIGKIAQCLFAVISQLTEFPECMVVSALDGILIVCQIWVVLHESDMLYHSLRCLFCNCFLCSCLFSCSLLGCSFLFCCHIS